MAWNGTASTCSDSPSWSPGVDLKELHGLVASSRPGRAGHRMGPSSVGITQTGFVNA